MTGIHWIAGQARNDKSAVIPDSIRDPVPRHPWIAGQARNDKRGTPTIGDRNDDSSYNLPLYATSTSGFELRNGLHKGPPRLLQLMEKI